MSVFDPRWHEKLKQAFKEAIEESKPSYEDYRWHSQEVTTAPYLFRVPPNKIYEILLYADVATIGDIQDENAIDNPTDVHSVFSSGVFGGTRWLPTTDKIWASTTLAADVEVFERPPHGLELSGGKGLYFQNVPAHIEWRDVTKLRCKT